MKHLKLIIIFLFIPILASAQFYVTGDDPGHLKWYSIKTDSYEVIYPEGTDSLAKVYAGKLEKFKIPVSRTSGYITGEGDGRLMPVVLHAHNTSNGSVAWAPKRMDLFTIPSAYSPEPFPWSTMLSIHESRHVTQMQFGMTGNIKYGTWAFGEMFNILVSIIYPGMAMIEGDAVIAETAFTRSGRGRIADFLNYYRVAFDNGDSRSWEQWRYGSQRNYTPDYYALGYLTLGGFRYLYDCPDFTDQAQHLAARNPFNFGAYHATTKKVSGKKFKEAFQEVKDTVTALWAADAAARAPFMPSEPVTGKTRHYTDYEGMIAVGHDLYAIKKGFVNAPALVRIGADGSESILSNFSYETSKLNWSETQNRLYWSESVPDPRWSMKFNSKIRYADPRKTGKKSLSKGKTGLLFNPVADAEGISAVEYLVEGGSAIVRLDTGTGEKVSYAEAPDSLQIVEIVEGGNVLYATAISDNGYGIYSYENMKWNTLLEPSPVMITGFKDCREGLMFCSDRTGVNELYIFDPASREIIQKTNTKYGSKDHQWSEDGQYLYYTSQTMKGKHIFRTHADSLISRKVDFFERYSYPIAEKLAQQEKTVAHINGDAEAVPYVALKHSEPKRYSKLSHMFNLHSWAPVYVSVDRIMNMSFDYIWQAASLGISGIMQNRLATTVGEFGYSAHPDPFHPEKWRHSGHAKLTYSGLYPVIEASVDFNDRAARQYYACAYIQDKGTGMEVGNKELSNPYIQGKLSMYIPWKFSDGGWYRGLIPKVTYTISNDMFNTAMTVMSTRPEDGSVQGDPTFIGVTEGENTIRQNVTASLRGYTSMATPNSAVYPRWGLGLEVGASTGVESYQYIAPMGYIYAYGYVPGFTRTQGLKLTASLQMKLREDSYFSLPLRNVLPRGLSSNAALAQWLSIRNPQIAKFTADYAIPIYIGDIPLGGGCVYIKRMVLNPHFDYMKVGNKSLNSIGTELLFDLNRALWIEWPCSIGATYSYNTGSGFKSIMSESGINMDRNHWGFVFNVSF